MKIPLRNTLIPIALLGVIAAQIWVGAIWIRTDGGIGDGVCCSFTAPVFEILLADGTNQLGWPWSTYRQSMGLLVWPALAARKIVGANVDFLLWLNLVVVVLTQLTLYDVGKRLSNPFAGLLAAGLFPMVPAVALMMRRWDAMIHQHFLLVIAMAIALRSRGLSRFASTMAFGGVAAVGSVLSARETDNLLFMAAIGSIAVGTTIQGLLSDHKLRSLLGSSLLAGLMALFMVHYAFPLVDFGYFQDEMGNRTYTEGAQRLSLAAVTAYPLRLYTDDFTPTFIIPFLVALVPFYREGRARIILTTWLILPLAALSLVGKKNYYYASVIYPVLPLIIGIGFSRFRPRILGFFFGTSTLLVGWAQFSSRSLPQSTFPEQLTQVKWTGDAGPQKHLFQGIVPLNLGPRGPSQHHRAIELMRSQVNQSSCACPDHTVFMGQGDISDLHLALAVVDPCMAVSTWPQVDHAPSVGWIVIESPGCMKQPPPAFLKDGFDLQTASGSGNECVALYKRTGRRTKRFCGSRGSPPD
jgi:hypothetical protein